MQDSSGINDEVAWALGRVRETVSRVGLTGDLEVVVLRPRRFAAGLEVVDYRLLHNLVTQVGDQYYGERAAAGIAGSPITTGPNQVTGMRLGSGTTAVAKTGAGAAIVTYISGSNQAIASGFPTSALQGGTSRRIQWQALWVAGDSTHAAIAETVITNENPLTDVAGSAANTVARALISPTVNKGALDTLTVTWSHDLLGA